ncbi:MAG: zinc-binding dehydrogenase, partial [Deltaproteobacteria bacterium]|nr:zinc-binding dehydrogenase [Nannocystaceae bacterium]
QAGERVLVTGASGGVGIHALQVAKALGAHVIAATTSNAKAALLREYGADEVVVGEPAQLHHAVKRATGGVGVEVALDCVGTPTLNAALRSLRQGGRLVVLGNVTTLRWEINPGFVILGELEVHGSAGCNRADLEQVLRWVVAGELRPVLQEVLPLAAAAEAQRRLEQRRVSGRLVLSPLR